MPEGSSSATPVTNPGPTFFRKPRARSRIVNRPSPAPKARRRHSHNPAASGTAARSTSAMASLTQAFRQMPQP